ncbi:aldehyde dehydrogenase family protein [Alteromonas portus]|uniref:aldehyde dehydrogenase family protein n=1 Tax=Alteromonas portus TaxID=2565549 RepID=UPI003BF7BE69
MKVYPSYIAGADALSDNWTYSIDASYMLQDFLKGLKLKRSLEKGKIDDTIVPEYVLAKCGLTQELDLDLALEKASAAAKVWSKFPVDTRVQLAEIFHKEVKARRSELIEVLIAEGHPRKLAEWEISGVISLTSPDNIKLLRSQMESDRVIGKRTLKLVRKPDGVVVFSPPQNAAAANSAGAIPALVVGNTLVMKAPKSCPYGVMYIWREIVAPILDKLGAPPGTLSIVCGNSKRIMSKWQASPYVNDIFFFGGSERGLEIGREANNTGKKAILELAGNDACTVWEDADLDKAADALTECFFGSSQICMVPKQAIIHPKIADELIEKLTERVLQIRPGLPGDKDVVLSPVMRSDDYFEYLDVSKKAGAQLLTGGYRVELDNSPSEAGPFISPTLIRIDGLDLARSLPCVKEETFFPLLPLVVPKESDELLDEIIDFVNENKYGLRNSFWTSSNRVIQQLSEHVTNGGLLKINDSHIGFVPWLGTHGGTGLSGGPHGELNYPLLKTSHLQGICIAKDVDPKEAVFDTESETI